MGPEPRERRPLSEIAASIRGRMPTSVVTGGAGFLGSHLCEALGTGAARDLRRQPRDRLAGQHRAPARTSFVFVPHDVTSGIEVAEPVDFVYHLASPASPIDYLRLPLQTLKVGSYGTHNALGLAKFKRARFLLASTSEVYGDPQVHPQPETLLGQRQPDRPARRLRRGEALRRGDDDGLSPPAGRRHRDRADLQHVRAEDAPQRRPRISTFLHQALEGKPLTVFGDGSQTRSLCYVDDLIRGLILLAESGEHLPVNIGNPDHEVTMLELAETIVRVTGSSSQIVFEALPVDDPQVRRPDITRARQVLGWEPEIDLGRGVAPLAHRHGA